MITIEKDAKAEEIFIHASPEDLRGFAKQLWQISEKAETKSKHKEHLTTTKGADSELSNKLQGELRKHTIIKKLTVICRDE